MALRRNFQRPIIRKVEELHKINNRITAPKIRLVVEGKEPEIYNTSVALDLAIEMGLDLIMISEKADPPVCKILDYKKYLYEQKKKQKELKSKQLKVVVKEIRFGPQTDEHDYEFKKKHAISFLKEGCKLKAFVFFKGRSIIFKDQGEIMLLKLAQELEEFGKIEQLPKLEGKRMIMMVAAKTKK